MTFMVVELQWFFLFLVAFQIGCRCHFVHSCLAVVFLVLLFLACGVLVVCCMLVFTGSLALLCLFVVDLFACGYG